MLLCGEGEMWGYGDVTMWGYGEVYLKRGLVFIDRYC